MAEVLRIRRSHLLPEELIDDILIRLPIKSIVRLESVCKSWNSKLHSTSFNELFRKRNNESESESETKTMKLEDLYKIAPKQLQKGRNLVPEVSVMGPLSNGIYCLTSIPLNYFGFNSYPGSKIALCNLSTRRFKFLPPLPSRLHTELDTIIWSNAVFGFDKAPNNDDYRVVVVINYKQNIFNRDPNTFDCFLVLVYSSNSGEWEILVDYIPSKKSVGSTSAMRTFTQRIRNIVTPIEVCSQRLLKGCWHWMVQQDQCFAVLSFNFDHQSFGLIKGPPGNIGGNESPARADVVVLHDHLAAICLRPYDYEYEVWMMTEYGVEKSWSKIFSIYNCYAEMLTKLYKVEYCEEKEESDGVFIERILFIDDWNQNIVSFDHQGERQVTTARYNFRDNIYLNTAGISSYKETVEYLH